MTIRKMLRILTATGLLLVGLALSAMAQEGTAPNAAAEFDSGQPYDDTLTPSSAPSSARSVGSSVQTSTGGAKDAEPKVKRPSNKNMLIIHGD